MDSSSERRKYKPILPKSLEDISKVLTEPSERSIKSLDPENAKAFFPLSSGQSLLSFKSGNHSQSKALTIGVVFSGGPAPGGHSVIAGVFDAVKQVNSESKVLGFLSGPQGLVEGRYELLTKEKVDQFRHMGGFDLLSSGRMKIETTEQFEKVEKVAESLHLDGIIIIGGDDSNTNAAVLAEYFLKGLSTSVIGVPKTIDGDLCNEYVELSFGFDTATKIYSQLISNLAKDAKSAEKYYHFVKIMGRSASHVALECALQVHPNMTLISEEIMKKKSSLMSIINDLSDMIEYRAKEGINYGVIVLPEGLIEAVDEISHLIKEINEVLSHSSSFDVKLLTINSQKLFLSLPPEIQKQLIYERDPHGNVQVSLIPTEKLFIHFVSIELERRKKLGTYKGKFAPLEHFFGYEGRCSFPSNFDATYCYCLGKGAVGLILHHKTGYMVGIKHLLKESSLWEVFGVPITSLINLEKRHGTMKPVIKKYLVDLESAPFLFFADSRDGWAVHDDYQEVMPMQFYGPPSISEVRPKILQN